VTYTISKVSENASIVKFRISDDFGTCGSVSCSPENQADLLACWKGSAPRSAAANTVHDGRRNPMVAAMLAAKKHPQTRQAILRG